ncbi:MAG: sensor histidine kinase, partial [Flavitalea sp.]
DDLNASFEKVFEAKTLDLKIKNEELKKSEERYHKMVEEVEDYAIILLDENGFIRNWNKGAEKIKGYKEQEILGKSFQVFYQPHDRESGLPFKLINEARTKGKAIHEGWRLRSDGSKFWGSIVLTALHGQQNEILGFSKVTRDLTERKLAEDKLRDYTNQLKFQNEQLEQFAYAASHDMKEPLRKILFYNNHLLDRVADLLPVKEREYLNRSINAARRMERLINDLLEYSKASCDTQGAEAVDLNEILDDIFISNKDVIDEKNAEIRHESLPAVTGIAFQLRQVFDNIISNALKYHHPDRPPVIEIDSTQVSGQNIPGLLADQQYHLISITDNGVGFDPEYSEKIFELFQRLGHVQYSGTGVGLALCKRIAQNHHGTIIAKGQENKGACFEIYLPV